MHVLLQVSCIGILYIYILDWIAGLGPFKKINRTF